MNNSGLIIVLIGEIFKLFGMSPEIEYVYFNAMIFLMVVGIIGIYSIAQIIMYKKMKVSVILGGKYLRYTIFFELFLLSIRGNLQNMEYLVGVLSVICICLVTMIIEAALKSCNEESVKASDYPNPDLYHTREKQLEKFIPVLEQQKTEPYALMISGDWGQGKTSFVMALEKRLNQDAFVWIKAGSEKSVKEIMTEISEQIMEILKRNGVLIEKDDLIEKYFLAFAGALSETGLKSFNALAGALGLGKGYEGKEYINRKMKELDKTIYLVIDDLDRCEQKYQEIMFQVIRESTELSHCKTIFLVDKQVFLNGRMDEQYLEKYISFTLDLCKVEYREIVSYVFDSIFENNFIEKMGSVLLKERDGSEVRNLIYQFPSAVLETLRGEISKVERESSKNKNEELQKKKIEDISATITKIETNITNSRKVKNYLKSIKRDITNLNLEINKCSDEFQNQDWLRSIIEVQFMKNFLGDIFRNIKLSGDIVMFGQSYQGYSVEIILGLRHGFLLHDRKKEEVLNRIIFDLDVADFENVMTEREKYYSELYSDKASIRNIIMYLECSRTYDDFNKILQIFNGQKFEKSEDREFFIKTVLGIMAKQTSGIKFSNHEFHDFSKKIIDCIKVWELTEREKEICIHEGKMIVRRVIVDNAWLLRNILSIFWGLTEIGEKWEVLSVSEVDEFYRMLKTLDENSKYKGLEDDVNKLLSIKTYYKNLEIELRKEKYVSMKMDFSSIFSEVDIIFEICEFWDDIESELVYKEKEPTSSFNRYFTLNGVYSFKEEVFLNVYALKKALKSLDDFYDSKATCYNSNYSYLLLRTAYKIVLLYEQASDWFQGQEQEISEILLRMAEKVYELDKLEDEYSRDGIDKIKIYTYKFMTYCELKTPK